MRRLANNIVLLYYRTLCALIFVYIREMQKIWNLENHFPVYTKHLAH